MKRCKPIPFYYGVSWPWQCAPYRSPQKSFQCLLQERDEAFKNARKSQCADFWRLVIDDINELLNRIRIDETPLRPSKFIRTSYPAP